MLGARLEIHARISAEAATGRARARRLLTAPPAGTGRAARAAVRCVARQIDARRATGGLAGGAHAGATRANPIGRASVVALPAARGGCREIHAAAATIGESAGAPLSPGLALALIAELVGRAAHAAASAIRDIAADGGAHATTLQRSFGAAAAALKAGIPSRSSRCSPCSRSAGRQPGPAGILDILSAGRQEAGGQKPARNSGQFTR
jgi:hypothetical protein